MFCKWACLEKVDFVAYVQFVQPPTIPSAIFPTFPLFEQVEFSPTRHTQRGPTIPKYTCLAKNLFHFSLVWFFCSNRIKSILNVSEVFSGKFHVILYSSNIFADFYSWTFMKKSEKTFELLHLNANPVRKWSNSCSIFDLFILYW